MDMSLTVIPLDITVFRISTSSLARYARGICRRPPKTLVNYRPAHTVNGLYLCTVVCAVALRLHPTLCHWLVSMAGYLP